jgi:4-hydroxy-tetrahydrodipicolinate synthase
MMEMLLKRQLEAGVKAVVVAGTTGEAPTLTDEEKLMLFRRCKEFVGDRMMIIAGTGSNSTEHAVWLSQEAENCGVDGLLVVSPYYNKATGQGVTAHYIAIAHAVKLPVILYNVPSRTGIDIPVSVYKTLSRIPNIAGVKEASGNIVKVARIIAECGKDLPVWSGNDDMITPILSLGGKGVISVVSNVFPEETVALVEAGMNGDFDTAADIQCQLMPVIDALFTEPNPMPVKEALRLIGFDCGGCRLPLTSVSPQVKEKLESILK